LIVSALYAQDTIGINSLPKAGFTYIVPNDTTTIYAITSGSQTPQTWDYSMLLEQYSKVPTYDSTSETGYASVFPTSNIFTYGPAALYSGLFGAAPVANQGFTNGYVFWKTDSTGFWIEGFRPDDNGNPYYETHITPHELLIPIPGYITRTDISNTSWTISIDQNASDVDTFYVSHAFKQFEYDAVGTIITPIDTYSNVVRLHDNTIKVDSVIVKMGNTIVYAMEMLRDTSNTYYYLDKNVDYPVLTSYADVNNQVKYTEYYKIKYPYDLGVNDLVSSVDVQVFPNPVTDVLQVVCSENGAALHLFSLTGQELLSQLLVQGENTILTDNLEKGMFFGMVIFEGKVIATQKMIKN
jgi:hypothetical protein